jgi:hypothetical protein
MVGFGFYFRPLMVVMVTLWGLVPFMELCHLLQPLLAVSILLMGWVIHLTHSQLSFERLCRLFFLFYCKSHFPFPTSNRKIKKKKKKKKKKKIDNIPFLLSSPPKMSTYPINYRPIDNVPKTTKTLSISPNDNKSVWIKVWSVIPDWDPNSFMNISPSKHLVLLEPRKRWS